MLQATLQEVTDFRDHLPRLRKLPEHLKLWNMPGQTFNSSLIPSDAARVASAVASSSVMSWSIRG
jgi:hypothetical protein